jgi:hypothetical protein
MTVAQTSLHGRKCVITDDGRLATLGTPYYVKFASATDGTNKSKVTLTVCDYEGVAVAACHVLDIILSDDAGGAGLTGTTASGNVVAGAKGVDLQAVTAKKHLRVQTDAAGIYELSITDTSKTQFYVCAAGANIPFHVAGRVLTAKYG